MDHPVRNFGEESFQTAMVLTTELTTANRKREKKNNKTNLIQNLP